jgi:hypothetical protein
MNDKKFVTYEEFGAVGDGVTEDFVAIKKAHDYANEMGLPVRARDDAHYYIHDTKIDGVVETAIIKTDVVWGNAKITIDDRDISPAEGDATYEYAHKPIFSVMPDNPSFKITEREVLDKIHIAPGVQKIDLALGYPALIIPFNREDLGERVYRRIGYGAGYGHVRHEIIVIDGEGNISEETPIMFEYPSLDYVMVHRCDDKPITILGGTVTTRASRVNILRDIGNGRTNEFGGYIQRSLKVFRSHTTVKGVKHYVTDEVTLKEQIKNGEYVHISSTYNPFFDAFSANEITFEDCVMTGRRCYGRPKNCVTGGTGGTYDIGGNSVNKLVFKNCNQHNFWIKYDENLDITPAKEGEPGAVPSMMLKDVEGLHVKVIWGIGGTNFCKNMEYINSTLSRFDAHAGLYNGKVIGSTVNALALTGAGDFIVEDTTWVSADPCYVFNSVFCFRDDYGSTWDGDIKVKNLKAYFTDNENAALYYQAYENWDFGYTCYTPSIEIDGFEAFSRDTREHFTGGRKIKFHGSTSSKEPAMHLSETVNTPATYLYVDLDGDGLVDGTKIPYDPKFVHSYDFRRGAVDGSKKNLNPTVPPSIVKIKNLRNDFKISVPKTSIFEGVDGGFFGKTKFYYNDEDYYLGTDHENTETFEFSDPDEFKKILYY